MKSENKISIEMKKKKKKKEKQVFNMTKRKHSVCLQY